MLEIYAAKSTVRLDISEAMAAIGEVRFTLDRNRTVFRDDAAGVATRTFQKPEILGFNLMLQARF